ncbi:hypothetical protein QYF36_008212 [Acer negundo]|nr:hypothetical protein QYF36_008212 [Acer negundo]
MRTPFHMKELTRTATVSSNWLQETAWWVEPVIASPTAYGDGLAFFLVPQGSRIPNVTNGGSFGLTNDDQPPNLTTNPFVAVEFDISELLGSSKRTCGY